jgi:Spy/CpxP family protein refolding chaperone
MSDNTKIWFATFVLVVFCAGLGAGILVGRWTVPDFRGGPGFMPGPGQGPGPGPGRGRMGGPEGPPPGMLLDRLEHELQLTPDQKDQVRVILDDNRKRMDAIHDDVQGRIDQEQRDMQAQIRKVLTTDQQPRFDRWLAEAPRGRGGRGRGRGIPNP